jgi:hypothetical protein
MSHENQTPRVNLEDVLTISEGAVEATAFLSTVPEGRFLLEQVASYRQAVVDTAREVFARSLVAKIGAGEIIDERRLARDAFEAAGIFCAIEKEWAVRNIEPALVELSDTVYEDRAGADEPEDD